MEMEVDKLGAWQEAMDGFDTTPVKKTASGKKLTTTACVNEIVNSIMGVIAATNADVITEMMMPNIQRKVEEEIGVIPKRVVIEWDGKANEVKGTTHEVFERVLQIATRKIPVYLTGPAGTGKNVICKQVAEALGLEFYFTNAVTQEYKLTGFIDANGNYQGTQFYDAFTKGGLFFLDEMDASIPETLVILNAAIANGYFNFPHGKFNAHPEFRVIAAGNTLGTGADINYTGRYSLDRATLNRFAVIKVDYSPKIEEAISDGDSELVSFARNFRKAAYDAGVECLFSYRQIQQIATLKDVVPVRELLDIVLLKGMDKDSARVIGDRIDKAENKYTKEFMKYYK